MSEPPKNYESLEEWCSELEKMNDKLRSESERLRAVNDRFRAALQGSINGCCGERAGKVFCENFGCGTLQKILKEAKCDA